MKELILVILVLDIIAEIFLIRRLEKERDDAEDRALTHFRKLNNIEYILKNSDKKKENYFITVDKIKRVITSDQTR